MDTAGQIDMLLRDVNWIRAQPCDGIRSEPTLIKSPQLMGCQQFRLAN